MSEGKGCLFEMTGNKLIEEVIIGDKEGEEISAEDL